jgi:hypothetical protein
MLRWTGRALRLATYIGVVSAVLAFLLVRSVRADMKETSLALGRDLLPFRDLLQGIHRVALNGQPVYVASAVTEQRMGQVLDRFESACRSRSGGLAEQFDALPESVRARLAEEQPAAWEQRLGILREERKEEASIMCLERRNGNGLRDAIQRLRAFVQSGDLYELGNLRYVYVRPTDHGRVHVLSTLSEGPFDLFGAIGKDRAEPTGVDPPEVPRPPESKRILSAEFEGAMYGAYMFATPRQPSEVLAFYDGDLPPRGWMRITGNSLLSGEIWQRDGVTMSLGAERSDDDEKTVVTFAQARTIAAGTGVSR